MANSNKVAESVKVRKVIDDWLNAMSKKDLEGIYKPISPGYVQHLPGVAPIRGLEGFKGVMEEYLPQFGPTTHIESAITVSDSCDLAYAIGKHDHVMFDKSGSTKLIDLHFIVLKKINGTWMIDGISEMS
jgi:ketosteroid isomerase-like protein